MIAASAYDYGFFMMPLILMPFIGMLRLIFRR